MRARAAPSSLRHPTTTRAVRCPWARSCSASARASQPPAFGVIGRRPRLRPPRAIRRGRVPHRASRGGRRASRRARASAASSACARSPLAQSQTWIWAASCWRARARPSSMAAVRVRPAPLPQRQLREEDVEDARPRYFEQVGARGLEVHPGGLEVPAADLQVGAEHEEQDGKFAVRDRSAAALRAVGLVPRRRSRAAPRWCRDEHGAVDPERGGAPRARARPSPPTRAAVPASSARR